MEKKSFKIWIAGVIFAVGTAIVYFFGTRSRRNVNRGNIDRAREQLDGERGRNKSEREGIKRERDSVGKQRKRLNRDKQLIAELKKRNKG